MSITRYGITDGTNERPIISGIVVHGDTVYISGVTADPVGDITAQTRQVLARIDAALQKAGTDKSKLLTAQVWLADMRLFGVVTQRTEARRCGCVKHGSSLHATKSRPMAHPGFQRTREPQVCMVRTP
jgi:enamine deaminase RidA (YjgF/YER057c/UK114 family)